MSIKFKQQPGGVKAADYFKPDPITPPMVKAVETQLREAYNKPGPKPSGSAKKQITLRLDQDVIEGFKSTGEGWQARMNAALRSHLKL